VDNKGQAPVRLSATFLTLCNFLFGPAALLMDMLSHSTAANAQRQWRLAIYGDVLNLWNDTADSEQGELTPPSAAEKKEASMVFERVVALLWARRWRVHPLKSRCVLESSYARVWEWSREMTEDSPGLVAREVEHFACWLVVHFANG